MSNRLPWEFNEKDNTWTVVIPVEPIPGQNGTWTIYFEARPAHCDRGRWLCKIDARGTVGPDCQEGFPRYFFNLAYGKEELEAWVNCRREVIPKELVLLHEKANGQR